MLSIPHLIVIFVVALVVFGPEKLPELARNFGKVMAEFRRATGDLRTTFEGHMRDLEREAESRRTAGPTAAAAAPAPAQPAATGPQPVPSAPARSVPSPPSDPPPGEANAAAYQTGVMDPMQDPFLSEFGFEPPPPEPPKEPQAAPPEAAAKADPEKAPHS
jgi:sec-independent protein translocase protein TatB